jgi:hypothetical protein
MVRGFPAIRLEDSRWRIAIVPAVLCMHAHGTALARVSRERGLPRSSVLGEAGKRRRLDPWWPEQAQELHAGAGARASSSGVRASTVMASSTSANPGSKQGRVSLERGRGSQPSREEAKRGSRDNQPPPSTIRWRRQWRAPLSRRRPGIGLPVSTVVWGVGERANGTAEGSRRGCSGFIPPGRHGLGCTSVERDWTPWAVLWNGVVGWAQGAG